MRNKLKPWPTSEAAKRAPLGRTFPVVEDADGKSRLAQSGTSSVTKLPYSRSSYSITIVTNRWVPCLRSLY